MFYRLWKKKKKQKNLGDGGNSGQNRQSITFGNKVAPKWTVFRINYWKAIDQCISTLKRRIRVPILKAVNSTQFQ